MNEPHLTSRAELLREDNQATVVREFGRNRLEPFKAPDGEQRITKHLSGGLPGWPRDGGERGPLLITAPVPRQLLGRGL